MTTQIRTEAITASASRVSGTLRTAVRTIASALGTVLVASFIIFVALDLTPGDPVDRLVGQRATNEQRQAAREALGLDDALPIRFVNWLTNAVQGDLGTSYIYRQDVVSLIEPRIVTTLLLVALAALITVIGGVTLGAVGGTSGRWRPVVAVLCGIGLSVPAFVSASVLIGIGGVQLGWFPTYGAGEGFVDRLHHLALPAIALALSWSAYVAQMTSAAVKEQIDRDHVKTAVGRGLPRKLTLRHHVLRNALPPVLTASGLTIAGLVAGSVVVESAFGIDGIGSFLVKGVLDKDAPVVLAISVFIVMVFVVIMSLLDVVLVALDPRSRGAGR